MAGKIFSTLVLALNLAVPSLFGGVRLFYVEPTTTTCGNNGVPVSVGVDLADDLVGWAFKVYYDPTLLTYQGANLAGPFSGWTWVTNTTGSDGHGSFILLEASGGAIPPGTGSSMCVSMTFDISPDVCDNTSTSLAWLDSAYPQHDLGSGLQTGPGMDGEVIISCPANPPVGNFNLLYPSDGAMDVPIALTLDWEDAPNADTYDLYFGTSSPPSLYQSNISESQFDISGLNYNTQYYWYILAYQAGGPCESLASSIFSFTTQPTPSPNLQFDDMTNLVDNCSLGGEGNQDGVIDPGEQIDFHLILINTGNATATGVTGVISTNEGGISLINDTANYPDIAQGAQGISLSAYTITLDPAIPCGTTLHFSLSVTANEGSWSDSFQMVVGSPQQTILLESFESWPPSNWQIINNGGDCVWESTQTTGRPNYAGGNGNAADADSDLCGNGTTMDTELWTPSLDFSSVSSATLTFTASYNNESSLEDFFAVDASSDGGVTWDNLLFWQEDHSAYGPGEIVSLDLSGYIGNPNVIIRFYYVANSWDWWAEIDDVKVEVVSSNYQCHACSAGCLADLGDVDMDFGISAYDASLILQYLVALITLTPDQLCRADTDQDSLISSFDASLILQCVVDYCAGLPADFLGSCQSHGYCQ